MDGIYTMASASVSSLYGNVTAAIRELLLSKFPKEYFKYISTSTELGFVNMKRQFGGTNGTIEIRKRRKPYLIIQPVFREPDRDTFLQEIPLTKNIDDLQYRVDKRYLFDIIKDPKYGYNLKFKLNRDRIEFEVRLVLSTLHQQLDIYKAMVNQMVWERSFTKPTALEAIIPKTMMQHIGKLCKMDIANDPYMAPVLLEHLNTCSMYPITFKLRNASATDEFYMYYMHNMVITFYDLSLEDGVKKNMVDDHYDITFRVSADFNLPGLYVISGNIEQLKHWKVVLTATDSNQSNNQLMGEESDTEFFPLFTIDNIYSRYPPEKDGMKLMGSARFVCDKKTMKGTSDYIYIDKLFTTDQEKIIKAYTGFRINPDTLVRLIVLKDNEELALNEGYKINWQKMEMEILNADSHATYRFIVYINLGKLNEMLATIQHHQSSEKSGLEDNSIDWDKILERQDQSGYIVNLLDDTQIESQDPEGQFKRKESQDAIANMANLDENIDWTLETIGVRTTWQSAFNNNDHDIELIEDDPEHIYEFSVVDNETGESQFIANMASPNNPLAEEENAVIVVPIWETILTYELYENLIKQDMIGQKIEMEEVSEGNFREAKGIGGVVQDWFHILSASDLYNNLNSFSFEPPIR